MRIAQKSSDRLAENRDAYRRLFKWGSGKDEVHSVSIIQLKDTVYLLLFDKLTVDSNTKISEESNERR
ncbi:hypothetical protein DPMN_123677 [Dreissena polymorpha]|uniref:Uncharacterized protein n=1 Tax=Dreissena polymorpha TaxID=45954 RepID=A0A9D4GUX4_DREPO|nr:hypothetical protein DPMN_123677 [Dreissena polymorpha]